MAHADAWWSAEAVSAGAAGRWRLSYTNSCTYMPLMLGAYGWAFMRPIRKLYYNMTITAVSVVVAVLIGGLETLNLIGDQLGLTDGGGFWGAIGAINDNFGVLGYVIIGIFVLSWVGSVVFYNLKGYDDLEVNTAEGG